MISLADLRASGFTVRRETPGMLDGCLNVIIQTQEQLERTAVIRRPGCHPELMALTRLTVSVDAPTARIVDDNRLAAVRGGRASAASKRREVEV